MPQIFITCNGAKQIHCVADTDTGTDTDTDTDTGTDTDTDRIEDRMSQHNAREGNAHYLQQLEQLRTSRAATLQLMGDMYDRQQLSMYGRAPVQPEASAMHVYPASAWQQPQLTVHPMSRLHTQNQSPASPRVAGATDEVLLHHRATQRISTMWRG